MTDNRDLLSRPTRNLKELQALYERTEHLDRAEEARYQAVLAELERRAQTGITCASGLEAPALYATTPLEEWQSDAPALCYRCDIVVARKQCAGCKEVFCAPCFASHVQESTLAQ